MDKKDLYMALAELLRTYTVSDIDKAISNVSKLYLAEANMGNITKIKGEKNATSKKKTYN